MVHNDDLFAPSNVIESVPMPDADVGFMRNWLTPHQAQALFADLLQTTPWRQEQIQVWGKVHAQPRLTAWYGDPHCAYTYSGLALQPLPWTPVLLSLKEKIQLVSGTTFNCVLINLYRNENDSVGWHADNEAELGAQPQIASLSLGQTRTFKLKHQQHPKVAAVTMALESGSLLIMRGTTQEYWQHAILKEKRACQPRINLTFRKIIF